ncbi:MAG: hypothetical protein HDQ88_06405 [Clostridia bacterium]|nr:hypothetical protein [Clostridia bacterium]
MLIPWQIQGEIKETTIYAALDTIQRILENNEFLGRKPQDLKSMEVIEKLRQVLRKTSIHLDPNPYEQELNVIRNAIENLENRILNGTLDDHWPEWDYSLDRFVWPTHFDVDFSDQETHDLLTGFVTLRIKILGVEIAETDNGTATCPGCGNTIYHTNEQDACGHCGTRFIWPSDDDGEETNGKSFKERLTTNMIKKYAKKFIIVAIVCILLGIFVPCVRTIPTGYTGIRTTLDRIDQNPVRSSPTFLVPFVQDLELVNNKQQTTTHDDRIWGESEDQTVVFMEGVTIAYQINPDWSVWLYSNVTDYKSNALPANIIQSSMKSAMQSLKTDKVTKREQIEPLAVEKLQSAITQKYDGNEVITIISVNVNNIDFEDEYNKVIAERQQAQVKYETQQIDIKTQLEKADADKKEREIKAEAAAIEKTTQADAEAEVIKTKAEAQVEANRKLAESLSQNLIDYETIQKWNGELPYVQGGNAIIDITGKRNGTTDTEPAPTE